MVQDAGYAVPGLALKSGQHRTSLKFRPLRNLSTSMGATIGDSESKVREIVGKPSKVEDEGSRKQYHSLTYKYKTKKVQDTAITYEHKYVFKEGSLIEIQIGRYLD